MFGNTQFYKHEGRSYHADCYERHIAKRCTHCNKALMGRYQFNHWGDHFCVEHTKQYPPCSYCGRLVPHISRRSRRRSVEDVRCDICASTAIESAPQAKHLMPQLIAWVEAQGLIFRKKTFRLEVLDRAEFLSRDGHRDPLGLTTTTRYMRNKRLDRIEVNSVAILQGLPHALFEGVCVHELGHVWMAQHKIVGLPKVEEEGVCELLSHRHYLSIGS
ncbi:MAG: protein DA1, partial [Candidatus Promineifilaceae bacterium]